MNLSLQIRLDFEATVPLRSFPLLRPPCKRWRHQFRQANTTAQIYVNLELAASCRNGEALQPSRAASER